MTANPEIAALIAEADECLTRAEDAQMDGKAGLCDRLCRKAQRLRLQALETMPAGPARLALLMEVAFTAEATDDLRRCCWAVREAVLCGPDEDQLETLRDHWESSAWTLRGDRAFPEPPSPDDRPRSPLPGQMSFLEDGS